ncbi:hypothetical protein WI72_14645 [Burkholderia ubonensis]|nr:hypothetical protein WI72_14645 [Burkholderia ubonensis]KVD97106.1 hypothetical protein WI90_33030 [Burkholderia ubonensis]
MARSSQPRCRHKRTVSASHDQLHEIVFSHAADEEGFRKTIQALGLDHAAPRIALAIECERLERGAMRSDRELDRIVLSVARHLACRKDDLVDVWHRDCLVIWAPCNPRANRRARATGASMDA